MIRDVPLAYLRTSAHEVGHQYNLHHRDASMHIDGSGQRKYSIMNQTRIIQKYGAVAGTSGWPNRWNWNLDLLNAIT